MQTRFGRGHTLGKRVAIVADTGGLLRALASRPDGKDAWPAYANVLRTARAVIVPSLGGVGAVAVGALVT